MSNITTITTAGVLPFYDESWFYVVIALAITIVFQLLCFIIAAACKFDTITDLAGSMNFVALAIISLCVRGEYTTRQIVLTALITAIRLELAIFLLVRVCVRKKDDRFDETRDNCCKFLAFWIFQMFWVWVCMLPIVFVNSVIVDEPLGPADYVAWALLAFGFVFQVAADVHKYLFKKDKNNKNAIMDKGLWSISRHPNYFGEFLIWWGAFVAAIPLCLIGGNEPWFATVVSPLFTMLILLGGSGVPTAEGKNLARFYKNPAKRDAYARYHKRTPPVIPCCPCWYEKLPMGVKAVFCCECPCYQYREELNGNEKTTRESKSEPNDALLANDTTATHAKDVENPEQISPEGSIEE